MENGETTSFAGLSHAAIDRWLAVAALIGGMVWLALGILTPTTADRATENFWSRLWSPVLALIALGFFGLLRSPRYAGWRWMRVGLAAIVIGLMVMALGNIAEYWLFVDQHHGELNARNISWIGLLLGLLLAMLGATAAGLVMLRKRSRPIWLGAALVLLLPVTLVAGALNLSLLFVPLGVLAIAVGIHGLVDTRQSPS